MTISFNNEALHFGILELLFFAGFQIVGLSCIMHFPSRS